MLRQNAMPGSPDTLRHSPDLFSRPAAQEQWAFVELESGRRVWVDLRDPGMSAGFLRGEWRHPESELLHSLLAPDAVFVDAGAGVGWFTLLAAGIVGPAGRVVAIEDDALRRGRLADTISSNALTGQCRVAGGPDVPDASQVPAPVRLLRAVPTGLLAASLGLVRALVERDRPALLLEGVTPASLLGPEGSPVAPWLRDMGYRVFRLTEGGVGREVRASAAEPAALPEDGQIGLVALRGDDVLRVTSVQFDARVADLEEALRRAAEREARARSEMVALRLRSRADIAARGKAEGDLHAAQAQAAEQASARAAAERSAALRAAEAVALAARLGQVENSTIWRVTSPVRRLAMRLPPGLRRLARRTLKLGWWTVTLQLHRRLRDVARARSGQAAAPPGAPAAAPASAAEESRVGQPPRDAVAAFVEPIAWGPRPPVLPSPQRPRALVIDSRWPRPKRDSGSLDAVLQVRMLQRLGYEVVFAGEVSWGEPSGDRDALAAEGVVCLDAALTPSIGAFLASDGPTLDLCILSRVTSGGRYFESVRRHAPQACVLFNTVDLHHLREERQARLAGEPAALRAAEATRERETYLARQADATIVVSAVEQDVLRRLVPGARVVEMPLTRPVRTGDAVPPFARRRGVGFVGGFDHLPNVDAVRFLFSDIWPLVHARDPSLELQLVGADLPPALLAEAPPGVRYLGALDDLDGWLDQLRVTVAPLRFGAGAKGKVASSLCAGVPCIGTPVAAEGMRVVSGRDMLVEESPAAFAAAVCDLHEDAAAWSRLSAGALAKAQADLSVDAGERRLADLLLSLNLPCQR